MTTTLITGANRGLGRDTARQLLEAGHTVWLGARDEASGRAAAADLGARFVHLDVTDDDSVAAALDQVGVAGGLDVLVNNAGIARYGMRSADALAVLDTNVVGIVRVTEAALPLLRRSAHPVVVNVSSALGSFTANHDTVRPASHFVSGLYGVSKAAVSMLTVQYARAVPEVTFVAVEPGYSQTGLGDVDHSGGQPVEDGAAVIARWAQAGPGIPTGTFQEAGGVLGW
ncbi:short chain dehydrogenase [Microlunatus sagamiharensis]|uniref:Short chain dehydrogenase n=1 Tax=Microlunatus sagamiharensis TaxID=546874 RepID=A0A1H2M578_9ACTN|nr:SDR family NAD(P)-dependent oxidoreductase [Microlunatus sagamiharensis]SDU88329.1 short chain dehydrogenase [Microlunatus sagamiharensis]